MGDRLGAKWVIGIERNTHQHQVFPRRFVRSSIHRVTVAIQQVLMQRSVFHLTTLILISACALNRHREQAIPSPPCSTCQIHGLVLDATTGRAVIGAEVGAWGVKPIVRTDSLGRFTLPRPSPRSFVLLARAVGFDPARCVISGSTESLQVFRLRPRPVGIRDTIVSGKAPVRR